MSLAEQDEEREDEEPADELAEEPRKRRLSGKKLVLFFILPILLVLGAAGGAGAYFLGVFDPSDEAAAEAQLDEDAEADAKPVLFYDLPEILVNLNTGSKQSTYLKIRVALELDDPETISRVETLLPRVIDNFQVYLRELRREDLSGSAGIFRLKEELLLRVNAALHPARINDVLFKEMLIQ